MEKAIRVSSWLSVLLLAGAVFAWVAYNLIGQEVDTQGVLQEPFALIPITWLLLALGLMTGAFHLIMRFILKARKAKLR